AAGCVIYYYDNDGDLDYMPGASSKCLCSSGYISKFTGTTAYDCDDSNLDVNPSKTEIMGNSTDDDCDGTSDENSTYTISWCNTQWPYTININWGDATGNIYGRVYVPGLTDASGDPNLIMVKLAIAPADYTSISEFKLFNATYNASCSGCGNNYEYMANIPFGQYYVPGKYEYVYGFMYSVDGGINWVYGATDNTFYKNWVYIDRAKLGRLTLLNPTQANHIVIREFMVAGVDADDEFVEWYNPTSQPINIKNYRLKYSAAGTIPNCTVSPYYTITSDFYIPAKGYVLFARSGKTYAGIADFTQTSISMSGSTGHIAICDSSNNIIDKVGYGSSAISPEGTYGPVAPANKSVERKARSTSTSDTMKIGGVDEFLGNGYDSDNNSQDFVQRDLPQPQNSQSPTEP
ncbi:MAG: lamin tail domain-containing protein, partial [Deltaproteobacteria bacterium]|nr:lamin tail domain-containing protein [Deltaproteobacteria bacterium]